MNRFIAHNIPKIDLHCHLDGSMSVELTQRLLKEMGETYSKEELEHALKAPMDCKSLAEYLERFDLPLRCLQTKRGLSAAAEDLALAAAKEHVAYIEVRFAPSLSTKQGLSVTEIIESVETGLSKARKKTGILTGIIVCTMRGLDSETNVRMLKEAREFLDAGVVGCDLAGDEKAYPLCGFREVFAAAKKFELPFTIHAGECGDAGNIREAVELGAARIGHGIAMKGNDALKKLCADRKVCVELCPTSNLQTKAVASMEQYPFQEFYEAGIPLSVNTDNRTVSDTTSTDELMRLADAGMLTEAQCEKIYMASIASIFAGDDVKQKLWSQWASMFAV